MSMSQTTGPPASAIADNINTVGLGYGIAIAVGLLVLISTIMLASYICVRVQGRPRNARVRATTESAGLESNGGTGHGRGVDIIDIGIITGYGDSSYGIAGENEHNNAGISTGHGGEWTIGGLDEATLDSYPKFSYAQKKLFHGNKRDADDDTSCSICLSDYCDGELIRMLPDCRHSFHANCVDAWLRMHASCPMCRTSPLPTPVATPLSELIPLARNPLQSHYSSGQ